MTEGSEAQRMESKQGLRDIIDHLIGTDIGIDNTATATITTQEGSANQNCNLVVSVASEGKEEGSIAMTEEKRCDHEINTMTRAYPLEILQVPFHDTPSQEIISQQITTQEQSVSRNHVVYHASYIWQSISSNRS